MLREVYKTDEKGIYIEPIQVSEEGGLPLYCIETKPTEGLFRARWDALGQVWVEDATLEEIEASKKPTEDLESRIAALEAKVNSLS